MRELPAAEEKARAVRAMFDRIADRYDLLNRIISLGLDGGWRRRAVAALRLPPGSLVLDLACGTGGLCRQLRRAGHRALGVDFAARMLAAARTHASVVQADVLALPVAAHVADGVVCGFALRNVVDLHGLFAEAARALRPGGRAVFLEVDQPRNLLLRGGHRLWFRGAVPLVGALLSDAAAYRYLPRSVAYLPPRSELVAMLRRAGFPDAASRPLSGGLVQLLEGTRA